MEIVLLILADVALGGIAWRLGKKNEKSNNNMESAVNQMTLAVDEMRKMNAGLVHRMDNIEFRVVFLEGDK